MIHQDIVDRFVKESAVTVMTRGIIEHVFPAGYLDQLFRETAVEQRDGQLPFSLTVETLSLAVTSMRDSANSAYLACQDRFSVSVNSFYNKLQGVETRVSRELVRRSASKLVPVVEKLKSKNPALLKGYNVKIIDGNHLAATERRLKETQGRRAHPLPGFSVVVLDPRIRLILDVFPCEDAYAQERSLLDEVLTTVEKKDLWIADRAYCTSPFLYGLYEREAFFLVRQHATTLTEKTLVGQRRHIGRCKTGKVYEQELTFSHSGQTLSVRRITIELDRRTQDGAKEIHLITNLSHKATKLAMLYLARWKIENAFQELGQALNGEINTLVYPRAGLLAFCIAAYTFNIISTLKAAIRSAHRGQISIEEISGYYLAEEIAVTARGMVIAIPPAWWEENFSNVSPAKMARTLLSLAKNVSVKRFRKNTSRPRKPPAKRRGDYREHVSAARLIASRRE